MKTVNLIVSILIGIVTFCLILETLYGHNFYGWPLVLMAWAGFYAAQRITYNLLNQSPNQ